MVGANKVQILPVRRALSSVSTSGSKNDSVSLSSDSADDDGEGGGPSKKTKKPRTSKPKVRTGCTTCKIRRVKCDETKPACTRCTTTGRKCDGYYIPPRKNARKESPEARAPSAPLERSLDTIKGTPTELMAIEFFQARAGPSLASYFDASFWTRLVLQISRVEPAIHYAIIAVGYLNLQRQSMGSTLHMRRPVVMNDPLAASVPLKKARSDHNDPFALAQYNRAITLLAQRLKDPDAATEVALLACILFVCIEFLRGDVEPAFKHFKSGMGIALSSLKDSKSAGKVLVNQRIRENMLPFFNRLELLGMLFGQEPGYEYPTFLEDAVPKAFHSVRDARDSVVHLLNINMRWIRNVGRRKYQGGLEAEDFERQKALQHATEDWVTKLDALVITDNVSSRDLDAVRMLRIHQLVMHIWLGTACEIEECTTDKFLPQFEAVVELAESIQQCLGEFENRPTQQATFLFDMEIVSPLYFVGIKCRHPQLRRRALAVLRSSVRREGLWDSDMAAVIAGRVVTLEEINLTTLGGSDLPSERDRIHNTQILSMTGEMSSRHSLTIWSKPDGLDGRWDIRNEFLDFDVDALTEVRLRQKLSAHN
ncbi:hypothetical protein LTR78_008949 [Recurvomyces mirabilis]|uniref:Zn(2)-C6 fungal-type domain-containing protein n=1 Tax=Recurvomyces mirabilis TaxID=574656 RepID=A0AAE0TT25_9PEZI|nr:hypothetical protein LTR78_008949 [Recurvomyces mirabilis]KAK5159750.1 hypothetical protein LTS14_001855 [Recurvomyces mirabilis]